MNRENAFSMPGGDTIVMNRLQEKFKARGVDVDFSANPFVDAARYDIVHIFNLTLKELTDAFARNAASHNVPVVVTSLQEDFPLYFNKGEMVTHIIQKYIETGQSKLFFEQSMELLKQTPPAPVVTAPWTVINADLIFPCGATEEKFIKSLHPDAHTSCVPFGSTIKNLDAAPDLFYSRFGIKDFVLFVGRMEMRKNQLMLLKALEDDDIPIVFADGGFTYTPHYRHLCDQFKRKGKTLFTGRLDDEMLISAFKTARVHCVPSWYELPGLVTLEAARYGCAVAASSWGAISDYLGETCYYCAPDNHTSIRSAILNAFELGSPPGLFEKAQSYTWENSADVTLAKYAEVISSRNEHGINDRLEANGTTTKRELFFNRNTDTSLAFGNSAPTAGENTPESGAEENKPDRSVDHRPAASVVIVTYNSSSIILPCIRSVLPSLLPDDELVIVDNASRDNTCAIVKDAFNNHSAFKLMCNPRNEGFSAATNQGILATRNPLVVLLNPDTIVPKDWLNGMSRHLCSDVAAVGPVSNYVAGLQKMGLYQLEPLFPEMSVDSINGLFQKWNDGKGVETRLLIGFCMMIRRDALEKIGYLDNELFLGNDDLDVSWRLRLQGYQIMVATDVFVYHAGQVSFSSEPSETTKRLVQQSTDHLYRKLAAHYAPAPVPPPFELWAIDWFNPSAEALAATESDRLQKAKSDNQLVSIIILAWNQLQFTQTCLESINRNTPEPYQLIMVDNGSTDGTVPWLREMTRADSRIQVIENADNRGFAAGCNQGIKTAQGEYILLLNNDTVVTSGWLAGMRELLDHFPDAGIVGPMTNRASGVQVVADVGYRSLEELPSWVKGFRENNRYRVIPQRRIVGFCMLFKRELVEKIGFLDESFGPGNYEDDDYCLRAELAGYRNLVAGDIFIHHEGGATFSGNRLDRGGENRKNRSLFTQKWEPSRLEESVLRRWLVLNAIEEGERLVQQGKTAAAVDALLNKAVKVDPSSPAPYIKLAEMLIVAGRHDDALQVLPEMPPTTDRWTIYEIEAISHAALGNDGAARQAASQIQDRPRALVVLGTLTARSGNLAGAENMFRRAIEVDPYCGGAWLSLGMLLWGKMDQSGAYQAVRRAVVVDPLNEEAVKILEDMAGRNHSLEDVLLIVSDSAQQYPDNRNLGRDHAELLAKCGKGAEALNACEVFLVRFGVDEELLSLALHVRRQIGTHDRLAKLGNHSISLCMIVKNEEKYLAACLASLKPVVDEMIIVDTGSTDHTAEIATAFGAKVYHFPWNDNFSDARNCAINNARGKWVLVMDADEVLSVQDYEAVRNSVREAIGKKNAWSVLTRNYTTRVNTQGWTPIVGTYPDEERADGWHPSWKVRLFPSHPGIRFSGDVHEMVENSLRTLGYTVKKAPFVVHHYGELGEDDEESTEKRRRYFETGMKKLEKDPDDKAALFELAVQAGEMGSFEEAVELWNRLLRQLPDNEEALFNKGYCLMGLKRYPEALDVSRRVLELDPAHKEAAFNYGTCELYVGNPAHALTVVAPVAERNPDYPLLQTLLGVLFACTGEKNKAMRCFEPLKQQGYAVDAYVQERIQTLRSLNRGELAECLINRESWKKA